MDSLKRVKTLQISVVAVAIVLLLRLFYIQVIDDSYKSNAANNVLRYTVQYPPRGEVYDRNGRFLVQSKEAYDLMAIPREIRPFDTAAMSRILGVSVEQIRKELRKASNFSRRRASVIFKQLPKEVKLRFEEHGFPGFFTVYRTVRSYPTKMAGNLLGYVGEVNDRIHGLEMGADDYLVKPFEMKELIARINAVLRRTEIPNDTSKRLTFDKLVIDLDSYELIVDGKKIDTPPKELELLYHLAATPNRVYTRNQLLDEVWGFDYFGDSRTVDVHIKRLREKVENVSDQWELKTVWGVGYKFEVKK